MIFFPLSPADEKERESLIGDLKTKLAFRTPEVLAHFVSRSDAEEEAIVHSYVGDYLYADEESGFDNVCLLSFLGAAVNDRNEDEKANVCFQWSWEGGRLIHRSIAGEDIGEGDAILVDYEQEGPKWLLPWAR